MQNRRTESETEKKKGRKAGKILLINLVRDGKTNIDGILNSIKNGKIGVRAE